MPCTEGRESRFLKWLVFRPSSVTADVTRLESLTPIARSSSHRDAPWRSSYTAKSPDGSLTAEIEHAREHSMGNPTIGTLQVHGVCEIPRCNPAIMWSQDSRYLAVPKWHRKFGLLLSQRIVILDFASKELLTSKFTRWLFIPKMFQHGRLELTISSSAGITWMSTSPMILRFPDDLRLFRSAPMPVQSGG
jgi:hypothetical protein